MRHLPIPTLQLALMSWLTASIFVSGEPLAADKPVFLYSRYFNAAGEKRYLPDGTYAEVLHRLRSEFDVRVHDKQLTAKSLTGVKLVLIANPSDRAAGTNCP